MDIILSNKQQRENIESSLSTDFECTDILFKYEVEFKNVDYYVRFGELDPKTRWVLHLSVIKPELINLLELLVPILVTQELTFQIPRTKEIAKHLLDGSLGYENIGKIVSIFPKNEQDANRVATQIIEMTASFKGPSIPTAIHLEGIVYTTHLEFAASEDIKLKENWPFNSIVIPNLNQKKGLLNNKYKIIDLVKADAKGQVIKCLYVKRFLIVKPCIIKEGKQHMWADKYGRDIQSRLLWQNEVYEKIKNKIPTPKVLEMFTYNNNLYLVTEFIRGNSLLSVVENIYGGKSWHSLNKTDKLHLLNLLLSITNIVTKLHEAGIIHRDLTPYNFLVTKKNYIYIIDMELSYSSKEQTPNPAFQQGTTGYMSQEQFSCSTPTVKEDIYGLGALMIFIFTGLLPVKFDTKIDTKLINNLNFFIRDLDISKIIAQCLCFTKEDRPSLKVITESLSKRKEEISLNTDPYKFIPTDDDEYNQRLNLIINKGIAGLASKGLLSTEGLWTSPVKNNEKFIGNEQVGREYNIGFNIGMSGMLYLLAYSKRMGIDITPCASLYNKNIEYIKKKYSVEQNNINSSLYSGSAGVCIAIYEGINSGILKKSDALQAICESIFKVKTTTLDIRSGISGQGLSLIHCRSMFDAKMVTEVLSSYVDTIVKFYIGGNGKLNSLAADINTSSLSKGTPGIIHFLCSAALIVDYEKLKEIIEKLVLFEISKIEKTLKEINKKKVGIQRNTERFRNLGTITSFLKAYEILKLPILKDSSESLLQEFPADFIHNDFTSISGLVKLGKVYLEAYRVFQEKEWLNRAGWLVSVFEHTTLSNLDGSIYWSMNLGDNAEASFMEGSSGIIHFLLQYSRRYKQLEPMLL